MQPSDAPDPSAKTMDYSRTVPRVGAGVIDAVIGLVSAIVLAAIGFRFGWRVLARVYEIVKWLPCFGPDNPDTWTFAILNAVVFTGPVAFLAVVITLLVARMRR